MLPAAIDRLTPRDLFEMNDGIDWVSDREWERAAFARGGSGARDVFIASYPRFRQDDVVVKVRSGHREEPVPGRGTFGG